MERVDMEVSRKKDLGFRGSLAEARHTIEGRQSTGVAVVLSIPFY
jgi:hypothetical protein